MRNALIAVAVLLLACSCGGGGGVIADSGSVPIGEQSLPPQAETDIDAAQDKLEDYAVDAIDGLRDILDMLKGIVDGTVSMPSYEISDIDLLTVSASFEVDLDGDDSSEVTGTIACVDEDGDPRLPVSFGTALALLGGTADVWEVVNEFDDGTTILVEADYDDGTLDATIEAGIVWADGWPSYAYGDVTVDAGDCDLTLSFEHVGTGIWNGTYPTVEADIYLETDDQTLSGTLTFDGTDTATIVVTFDGDETYTFELDLETGEITAVIS